MNCNCRLKSAMQPGGQIRCGTLALIRGKGTLPCFQVVAGVITVGINACCTAVGW